jgi:hypothetical protein
MTHTAVVESFFQLPIVFVGNQVADWTSDAGVSLPDDLLSVSEGTGDCNSAPEVQRAWSMPESIS